MRRVLFFFFVLGFSTVSSGTTYYISSSSGSDLNAGTSSDAAWQTLARVNSQTLLPGDSVLLRRGDVWNESLIPSSSGSSTSRILFDAYGAGAPPTLTGYYAMPSSGWVLVSGNSWKAPLPSTFTTVNFCLFGSIWGQKVAVGSSNLKGQWDFYIANGYLYVYSVGPPSTYYSSIVPMALSNVPVINVNGKSWLTFQHILVNWFDQYGVYVQGSSDHLVFANIEMDSMIPQGTQPLGFYVNASVPPSDIKIYNSEAHLNYDGFRFDGDASSITMVNDKAYGNRNGALVDNTGGVTYSYCHFYGSSLAVAGSTDVIANSGSGPIAGTGNIGADTAPAVQVWQRYPARVTLSVDDPGMTPGADAYYANTVLPIADAAGVPVGVAITVGYPLAQTLIGEFQSWVDAGRDVTSHSISHTYYTNLAAMDIRYIGGGSAARLNISNRVLTISVTGANDSVTFNLGQGQAQGTLYQLEQALLATGKFTVSENPVCQGPYGTGCSYYTKYALLSQDLADVSSIDVKSGSYSMQLDMTRLTTDEITLSRQWMNSNLSGLPSSPVYVYPGGYETAAMQAITAGVPYSGARGALKEDLGVKDTYASGFDVQNITSFGVNPAWVGIDAASLNKKVQAMVWKQMVWGVPWGIFWHYNAATSSGELSGIEVANLIGDLGASGATILSNTGLVNWLTTGTLEAGTNGIFYYKSAASSDFSANGAVDFRPTAASPVVDAGLNLGAAYQIDINGVNQNSYGSRWEIGAHAFQGYTTYGQSGASSGSYFTVGSAPQYVVTVVSSGDGSGAVTSSPAGIDCGSACSASFTNGTSVTLNADSDDDFGGWGGSCGCSGTGSCSFTIGAACTVTAEFDSASELLSVFAGNNQTGTIGMQLKNTLAARATRDGNPVAGITISYSDGGAGGSFSVTSGTSNTNGVVTSAYTLPSSAKTVTITAAGAEYLPTTFTATATANSQVLSVNAGNGQSGNVGTTLPTALSVLATLNNNAAAGVNVTFSDGGAGGSFGTPSGATNASGIASSTYTVPGSAKSVTITASASGYSSATFTETATSAAVGIPASLFAAGWNSISGTPPPPTWCPTDSTGAIAKVSVMRLWDSGVKWSQLESGNGTYNWNKMDAVLKTGNAYTGNVPLVANPSCPMSVIYTVGGTPKWATACSGSGDPSTCLPGPTGSRYGGGAQCAMPDHWSCLPPADINTDGTGTDAYFQNFIYTVAKRYGSAIQYYELPNEADSPNFWCQAGGTVPCGGGNSSTTANTAALKRAIRVGWDMKQIVHCLNPSAKILSPAFHVGTALTWMHQFAISSINAPAGSINGCTWSAQVVSGAQTFDIVNFHGRGAGAKNSDPTQFTIAYSNAVTEAKNDNLPDDYFFDDEMGYVGTDQAPNKDIQAAYVAISYVLRGSVSNPPMQLAGWYQWDSNQGGLQGTIAATAFNTVAGWLIGSTLNGCTTAGTVYTCTGKTASGTAFSILWDMGRNCDSGCTTGNQGAAGYSSWTDIAGAVHTVSGGVVPVGLKPVRVQ
jgi:parallel beta helix pectate lyase-like protein